MKPSTPRSISRQGSNSTTLRRLNERRLLAVLRRLEESSKAELARHLNLTQNTIGQIVQDLVRDGLITSVGRRMGERGQPATLLRLDPRGAYSIGIKLGRRALLAMIVDLTGAVVKCRHGECSLDTPEQALQLARRSLREIRRSLPKDRRGRLVGVGVSVPSDLGYDLAQPLQDLIDVPVLIESHAAAAAVAELYHGHGKQLDDFACVYIGSAIGAGLVLDGDYRRGIGTGAGQIGLIPVAASRLAVTPAAGGRALLADRASAASLLRHLQASGATLEPRASLCHLMAQNAGPVADWLDDCAEALAVPLLSMARLVDVKAIILDGALPSGAVASLLERVRLLLAELTTGPPPELRQGSNGRLAGVLGAALLPLHSRHGYPNSGLAIRELGSAPST